MGGGRCVVSQIVYELAHDVIDLEFEALGAPALKNIRERIPVYGVVDPLLQRQFSERPAVPQIEVLKGAFVARGPALDHDVRLLLGYLALCPGHADSLERLAQDAMLQQRLLVNNPRDVAYEDALALYRDAYGACK